MKRAGIKEAWSYKFNGCGIVQWGEIPTGERTIPTTGVISNSCIQKQFRDGTHTEIKWDGECKVKMGDLVILDSDARIIVTNRGKK